MSNENNMYVEFENFDETTIELNLMYLQKSYLKM